MRIKRGVNAHKKSPPNYKYTKFRLNMNYGLIFNRRDAMRLYPTVLIA